jgi:hypothetical protein
MDNFLGIFDAAFPAITARARARARKARQVRHADILPAR